MIIIHRERPRIFIALILAVSTLLSLNLVTLDQGMTEKKITESKPIYYQNKAIFLMYHHIDPKEKGAAISPNRFEDHMRSLATNHFNVISIEDYIAFSKGKQKIPNNAVVITFDDGYESFFTYADPILRKYHFPAVNFIIVRSTDNPDPKELPHLKWWQMRWMQRNGMSFYSHTYDQHTFLPSNAQGARKAALMSPKFLDSWQRIESSNEYQARVYGDLVLANKRLDQELGDQHNILAFPYGAYNPLVMELGRKAGIEFFITTKPGINEKNNREILRINAGNPHMSGDALVATITLQAVFPTIRK